MDPSRPDTAACSMSLTTSSLIGLGLLCSAFVYRFHHLELVAALAATNCYRSRSAAHSDETYNKYLMANLIRVHNFNKQNNKIIILEESKK
ncbi:hypothetical protein BpHYR1_051682 [Brachionus plicatilis]|uniref:Uncharacterized protein n=1 Tax=Brachionus plicatilis TaxID=10195 RepID=A0A3M7SQF3_BRAPC|nr:hypothetical protein BpHYR1_051682 [Brachionus plicatilis]